MRRSPRADSPEVLRVSESSPSCAESSFRELDDVFLQTQTRIWLGEVLHARFDEETTIANLLADGELLFQVSKVVWEMLQAISAETEYLEPSVNELSVPGKSRGRYLPYSNVDLFLKICKILGLTSVDLFSPSDVVEKRDTRRVCMCIRSLSKKARSKHLNIPDFDVVTYTIAMPTDMVEYIRRSLEQSHSSSSTFVVCSRCMHSKVKNKEKRQVVDCLSTVSDDADSNFKAIDYQGPKSNASYNAKSSLCGENSPDGDSVVDNFGTPENIFRLDVKCQHKDGQRIDQFGSIVESAESLNSCSMTCEKSLFPGQSITMSCQQCLQCHTVLNATCKYCRRAHDFGKEKCAENVDHCETSGSFGCRPIAALCCGESVHQDVNSSNCFSDAMSSDSCLSFDDMSEDPNNASAGPSDFRSIVSRISNGSSIVDGDCRDYGTTSNYSSSCNAVRPEDCITVGDGLGSDDIDISKSWSLRKIGKSNYLDVLGVEAEMVNFSRKCENFSSGNASEYVYRNQSNGNLLEPSNFIGDAFRPNYIYESSVMRNGDDGLVISSKCIPSHKNYAGYVCSCPIPKYKDTGEMFDAVLTDGQEALATVSDNKTGCTMTKHLSDPALSLSFFRYIENVHENKNANCKDVSCGLWLNGLSHGYETHHEKGDSETILECEWQGLFVKHKEPFNTSDKHEVLLAVVESLCSEHTIACNDLTACGGNKEEDSMTEGLERRLAQKGSIDSEEDSMMSVGIGESIPNSKPMCIDGKEDTYMECVRTGDSDVSSPKPLSFISGVNKEESILISRKGGLSCSTASLDISEFDCTSSLPLIRKSSSQSACESTPINQFIGVDKVDAKQLFHEGESQVVEPSMSHQYAGSTRSMHKETDEERNLDAVGRAANNSGKKLILKTIAGGMTLFGALLLLHLGSKGKGAISVNRNCDKTMPSRTQIRSQERQQTEKDNLKA